MANEILDIRTLMNSRRQDLEALLVGSGLTVEKFSSTVFQLWSKSGRDLSQCTADSVIASILAIADMGLTLTPSLAHAYIVKYGTVATPIISYLGLIYMARRDGLVQDIRFGIRREGDDFRYEPNNIHEPVHHVPSDPSVGRTLGYYCIAYLANGYVRGLYMTKQEIDSYKAAYSPNADKGPMAKNPHTYGIKTVVRQCLKYTQLGGKVAQAFSFGGESESAGDNLSVEVKSVANDLDHPPAAGAVEDDPMIDDEAFDAILKAGRVAGWSPSELDSLAADEFGADQVGGLRASQLAAYLKKLER